MKTLRNIPCTVLLILMLSTLLLRAAAESPTEIRQGDIVCFGMPDDACGFDGRWLVLDAEHTNTGEKGMFLVSLGLIGDEEGKSLLFRDTENLTVSVSVNQEGAAASCLGATDYQGSNIQRWCGDFAQSHLTQAEYDALLPAFKSDEAAAVPVFGTRDQDNANGNMNFDPVTEILNGDRLFLLSAEEAVSEQNGFADAHSRIARYKGTEGNYWLRSPCASAFPLDVGVVFSFGAVKGFPINGSYSEKMNMYARPACNLDIGRITQIERLAVRGRTSIWLLNFGEHNGQSYDTTLPEIWMYWG